MKKLVLAAILGLGVVGLNAENLSDEQTNQLIDDCLYNKNVSSCQRLANSGDLTSAEQCNKEACNDIGLFIMQPKIINRLSNTTKRLVS